MADKNFEDATIMASLQIIPGEIGTLLVSIDGINMADLPPQIVDVEIGNIDAVMGDLITKLEISYAEYLVTKASKKSKKKTNKKRRAAVSSKKPTVVKESSPVLEEKAEKVEASEAVISKENAGPVDSAAGVIETEDETEVPEDSEAAGADDKETKADISGEVNTLFDMDY